MPGLPLYRDADDKRQREVRNGVIQFAAVLDYVRKWNAGACRLTPDILCELQRLAVNQIYSCAGRLRDGPVSISGVEHQPPVHTEVVGLVDGMCEYVNSRWDLTAIHLSSYVMWRLNWIHPFFGGNGRTARSVSYLVLCARLGFELPGETVIPDLILSCRDRYYGALRAADQSFKSGDGDLSEMESLLSSLLAKQLLEVHAKATGRTDASGSL